MTCRHEMPERVCSICNERTRRRSSKVEARTTARYSTPCSWCDHTIEEGEPIVYLLGDWVHAIHERKRRR